MSPSLRIEVIQIGGLEELFFGNAGDALDHLRRVARVMFLQQLEHALGVLQRQVVVDFFRQGRQWWGRGTLSRLHACVFRGCRAAARVVPCGAVVGLLLRVEAGKHTIGVAGQLEVAFDDERRVRVVDQILLRDAVVLDGVANDAAEEGDVRPGANLAVEIGDRGGCA